MEKVQIDLPHITLSIVDQTTNKFGIGIAYLDNFSKLL